jgi:undecaprenyl diphosphate synthase
LAFRQTATKFLAALPPEAKPLHCLEAQRKARGFPQGRRQAAPFSFIWLMGLVADRVYSWDIMLSDFSNLVAPGSREESLLKAIAWERLPKHVAIIMDGNGRWAAQRGQPRIAGHKAGVEAVRASVDTGARLGLEALTLYAFSTENWKRPRLEVDALMRMLRRYLRLELDAIHKQNIKFQTIGRTGALPENVRKEIARATEITAKNKGMVLSVALNYGGRAEIVDACKAAVRRLVDEGSKPDEITEERIAIELYTRNLPELDLLVRTSGELRLSNFLLWQSAYSEIHVTETFWPDFRRQQLLEAVIDYQGRNRRFGGLKLVVGREG